MRDLARESRTYELMTILSPDVPEEEIPGALERISGHVSGAGGSVDETLSDSPWGRRRLAYPIRYAGHDVRDGYYTLFRCSLTPNRVEEMERELRLNTQVMRYLVTSYTPVPIDPRAVEDAEIAAEDAAAAAYAAAQAEAARLATANAAAEAAEAGAVSAEAETEAPVAAADAVIEAPAALADAPTEIPAPEAIEEAPAPETAEEAPLTATVAAAESAESAPDEPAIEDVEPASAGVATDESADADAATAERETAEEV